MFKLSEEDRKLMAAMRIRVNKAVEDLHKEHGSQAAAKEKK